MITRWTARWRRIRRWLSRSEWDVRLLGLPRSQGTESEPGLVMIQIDALARPQLEKAIKSGRMPFLRKLIQREGYKLHSMYSGLPASTPAVQGELFYGQKCAVPSFDYYDRKTGELKRMFSSGPANEVEARLKEGGQKGLLEGGSAYCNIYSGGAEEVHFCAVTGGLPSKRRAVHPLRRAGFALWHCMSMFRMLALVVIELILAFGDVLCGNTRMRELGYELKFIPCRVVVSVVLRELATIGALMDIARGLPIIQLNFLGYDEQAHRRGPSSAFAHWTLSGLDKAIKQLWSAAHRSANRDYDVWIYSDHGQEHTRPYEYEQERTIDEAVEAVLQSHTGGTVSKRLRKNKPSPTRSAWLGGWFEKWFTGNFWQSTAASGTEADDEKAWLASAGPVGHVYLKQPVADEQREVLARALVKEAGIPLVMVRESQNKARAFTPAGEFEMPRQAADVLGSEHPFLDDVADDLVELCHHKDAGDFVIGGFRLAAPLLSFPIEHGAHAGPGYQETHPFALLSADAPLPKLDRPYLRPLDLRRTVLHRLGRQSLDQTVRARRVPSEPNSIRIMTYNVHSCIGMDRKLSPARIARVIDQFQPDVIALQELDVRRARSGEIDQAHEIARLVGMDHYFHPARQIADELYGDAVLSHLPMRLIRSGSLPRLANRPDLEPRGALWVEISLDGHLIQLINTHLGLLPRENWIQIEELLGPRWLSHPDCSGNVILCGDLNASPRSRSYRQLTRKLRDSQCEVKGHRPHATWPSNAPFNRIDHVFVSPGIRVLQCEAPRTNLARNASDHLPLIITIAIESEAKVARTKLISRDESLQIAAPVTGRG